MAKLTMSQAIVKFLDNQYIEFDGKEEKYVEGIFTIFGHGMAVGLGQALEQGNHNLKTYQGRNEQGMCHTAIAYAKQNNRRKIIPCSASVGPGSANMVTAAATATVNQIPLLLFPSDTFASRQPDPVLQQVQQSYDLSITTNDVFKPVSKYWDRINRPEQLMSALINAMRVLTDPEETGACVIAMPQDVEGESYDYPDYFFKKRIHKIRRSVPVDSDIKDAVELIKNSKKPLAIIGGGVKYSEAGERIDEFLNKYNIPFGETQAGKSAIKSSSDMCLGGIGVTGTYAANIIAKEADLILTFGSRLSDFTTSSKWLFQNPKVEFVNINVSRFDAYKMDGLQIVADAKLSASYLDDELSKINYRSSYSNEILEAKSWWSEELTKLKNYNYDDPNFEPIIKLRDPRTVDEFVKLTGGTITQTSAIIALNEFIKDNGIVITAGGSLPSDLQRLWQTDVKDGYHAEYGYSCMGYEVAATLGVKWAKPDKEVFAVVGDASFQMLNSELQTIIQEKQKVNVVIFDNSGFGCINNLQMNHKVGSLATEFRYRDGQTTSGDLLTADYTKVGEAYGWTTYSCKTLDEFKQALEDSKSSDKPVLFDLKVIPKTMIDGYEAWWNVGVAEVGKDEAQKEVYENIINHRNESRKY
ncbi:MULTISPECIES: 3D-(3,5/4)-trihydroxycyclohexane-1,2-dione acylhydrolase (decyclizing) [Anaerococcus]|uniref:3D-(3,5/4)-trihydroxycyclohexane-1,2-dione acylhydrolase (decyclizing) n=1 Tax=Anaerococcus TaxID=165779 RepID=UPI001AE71005|nr:MULTISPECIES: 3D-(3,5/4)-trihydroxycyclohexane-1,2-dione acylhydrolase (decyclizing) [Anaerococcus]MBP2069145.1 3D-(3,5/4)-trihydroxycyclohexane-1,2-dione acylhydrolase (decyclizing) [Anaerococcus nagyae]MDU1828320.1 3D-(3,5/4)-trihydroxycyclohexane-1,2-dione acylhydrolase (decyclizing) [Anaerococcus sp.]MDU1864401.1 3D-(3,5/4)-trihydroxycyclohexane-1,2-dione acylhydrolase (decyclizing) [Anaerococcus sp.]MDU2565192.1 3D-(3,5/4)-trihydroxycyclohexane-1,2-dione acylhydrolase (decyclizing) [Ana